MQLKRFVPRRSAYFWFPILLVCVPGVSVLAQDSVTTPVNYKIAFIGDQGYGVDARAVLNLIKSEEAQAVVHSGDFDYRDAPAAWDAQINAILGPEFPYFASVGNHDEGRYYGTGGYQEFMAARMIRLGITWDGDLGVKSSLHYNGLFFILTGPDVFGSGHADYIREKLAEDNSIWSISSWHKNMRLMQVGGKSDQTGWEVYEESRKGGAIIATGHEHSYSRTHLLNSCQNQTISSTSDTLVLTNDLLATETDEGQTFVFVSGLGGISIRDQEISGAWWASIYTSDQGANYGALFGNFNHNGNPHLAMFYFKDIDGVIPDSFYVISDVENSTLDVGSFNTDPPRDFRVEQNYPNPFNPVTNIRYDLPEAAQVRLRVYDLRGREVRTLIRGVQSPGVKTAVWDGRVATGAEVPTGIYDVRLVTPEYTKSIKMMLLK